MEDNLEVGEAKLCWTDVVFLASTLVPLNSKPKEPTHSFQWVLLGETLVISPSCEVGVVGSIPGRFNIERAWNGPVIPFHGFSGQPQCPRVRFA